MALSMLAILWSELFVGGEYSSASAMSPYFNRKPAIDYGIIVSLVEGFI